MKIGVLALQGDFEAHARVFRSLGAEVTFVRVPDKLESVDALVLPGGESTTMLNFLEEGGFLERLRDTAQRRPVFATCAGTILLAREVLAPSQPSLGLLDVSVERNAWGRQVHSSVERIEVTDLGVGTATPSGASTPDHGDVVSLEAVFIRAPRIRRVGPGVRVLGRREGEPVLVREGRILAATFHPELTRDDRVPRYFLERVAGS